MTRHASLHAADCVTRKSSHSLSSNRSRNPWMHDRQNSTNTISSINSTQGRLPAFYSANGHEPFVHQGHAVDPRSPYYLARPTSARSMTMPRIHDPNAYQARVERAPSVHTNPTILQQPRVPKYFDHVLSGLNSGCSTSRTSSDRPVTPVSLSTTDGIVDPCGGHCRTLERYCRRLLQIVFVTGISVGVTFVVRAYWLHNQRRGGDQLVLVYIGVLLVLVCALLLSIQCSVEQDAKRRKRNRRANAALITRNRTLSAVPLQEMGHGNRSMYNNNTRMVEELPQGRVFCQVPLLCPTEQYAVPGENAEGPRRNRVVRSQSHNGVPWWRRNELEVTSRNYNIV